MPLRSKTGVRQRNFEKKNVEKPSSQASQRLGSAPEASIKPSEAPQVVPGRKVDFFGEGAFFAFLKKMQSKNNEIRIPGPPGAWEAPQRPQLSPPSGPRSIPDF